MLFSDMDWGNWLKGLWAAVIGGGSNAVVSAVGLNMTDPNHFNSQTPDFYRVVGTLFCASAIVSFFMYLKQSPLPQVITKTTTRVSSEKIISPTKETKLETKIETVAETDNRPVAEDPKL
jgi:hypothetical protein